MGHAGKGVNEEVLNGDTRAGAVRGEEAGRKERKGNVKVRRCDFEGDKRRREKMMDSGEAEDADDATTKKKKARWKWLT